MSADHVERPADPQTASANSNSAPNVPPANHAESSIERQPWHSGATTQYVTLFLWIAFFDQIGARALPQGGLLWSVAGAALGGILCVLLFGLPLSFLGWRKNQGFMELCEGGFGTLGAKWLVNLAMIASQIIVFALAVHYGLDLTFRGLAHAGYLDPKVIEDGWRDRWVYPFSVLVWCVTFGMIGMGPVFANMIMTVTRNYAAFPAIALGAFLIWALVGMRDMDLGESFLPKMRQASANDWLAAMMTTQWCLGFYAAFAAFSADWGRVHRTKSDVWLSGWVGVAGASIAVAFTALTTVAILGRVGQEELTWRAVTIDRLGGWPATIAAWTIAVASMIAAVFAVRNWTVFWQRIAPRVAPVIWVSVGTICALPLILLGACERTDALLGILGALMAPAIGVVCANAWRGGGERPPQQGVRFAGVLAWTIGFAIGLIGPIAILTGAPPWTQAFPATLAAFLAGFVVFRISLISRH